MRVKANSFILVVVLGVLSGVAVACPASYVKDVARRNKGTALYDKASKVADKYMTNRGLNPTGMVGDITRPYVIGTTIVEHGLALRYVNVPKHNQPGDRINLNKDTTAEATRKALGQYAGQAGTANFNGLYGHAVLPAWWHFNHHFSYGLHLAGNIVPAASSTPLGG